jgi:hypothetical protein
VNIALAQFLVIVLPVLQYQQVSELKTFQEIRKDFVHAYNKLMMMDRVVIA